MPAASVETDSMANDPSEKDSASKPPASGAESKPVAPGAPVEKPAAPAAPAAPKAAAPPAKEAPAKPLPLDNELVQRLKARFGDAIREATLARKQAEDAIRDAEVTGVQTCALPISRLNSSHLRISSRRRH